jgi:hypothetical protein
MSIAALAPRRHSPASEPALLRALIENLYCDLLVLMDEARSAPSAGGVVDAALRIECAGESLMLSARLMQMLQWVVEARENLRRGDQYLPPVAHLPSFSAVKPGLPEPLADQCHAALRLAQRLYELVSRQPSATGSPAHAHFERLNAIFA